MKKLLTVITLTVLVNVQAAEVICEKDGRYWRPKNEMAKDIAKMYNVSTCQGGKFRKFVADNGLKFNVPAKRKKLTGDDILKKYANKK